MTITPRVLVCIQLFCWGIGLLTGLIIGMGVENRKHRRPAPSETEETER